MASPQLHAPPLPDRKPRDDEMDIFGLTHPGKVRSENQDQFLVCSLHKEAVTRQEGELRLKTIALLSTVTRGRHP